MGPTLFGALGALAVCLAALGSAVVPGHDHNQMQEDEGLVDGVVTVRISRGIIRGKLVQVPNGRPVRVFLGIPFAEAPVGELRFKAPVTKKPWKGIFNATSFGPICYQRSTQRVWDIEEVSGRKMLKQKKLKEFPMSEDCLTLNVYVPKFDNKEDYNLQMAPTTNPLTVLVYLHGGSYCMNGGRLYPGEKLASMGAIVVTLNYRLGPLGFLCTEDSVAPGNYGLLDQVEALRWVQDNIGALGGDPADVAIFGNSAGGASVTFHMLSQQSEGLFSSAMAQSGCANAPWALQLQPRSYVLKLAKNLGCPTEPTADMIDCIRTFSADLVVRKAPIADGLLVPFAPVIDGKYGGSFLTDHPDTLLRKGNFHGAHVPFLTGVTKDEVSIWFTTGPELEINQMRSFIQKRAKELLKDKHVTELNHAAVMHAIGVQYLVKRGITGTKGKGHTMALVDFISDVGIKAPCVQFLQNLVERSSSTLYMYEFGYYSRDDARSERHDWIGAYHESELQYVFGEPHLNYTNSLRLETDRSVSDFMMNMWINFAKYGNPTPATHNPLNITWKPYTTQHHAHLHVVDIPRMEENYQTESILFFNTFLPILSDHPLEDTKHKCRGKRHHRKWIVWTLSATVGALAILSTVLLVLTCRQRSHRSHRTFVTTNITKHAPLSPENSTAV